MSGKSFCLASLMAVVLGLGSVRGQGTTYAPPSTSAVTDGAPAAAAAPGHPAPSHWILYDKQPGCCGPTGRDGPIGYELYLRSGIALQVANSGLGKALDNGWVIEGGARTLFFNAEADRAWTADLGIGNTYNRVGDRTLMFPVRNLATNTGARINRNVSGADLNRSYVSFAGGREWYLWGSAEHDCTETNWRVGFDAGGKYGTEKLDLNEIRHFTDTTAGAFFSVHSDMEIPWGTCILQAGIRAEYGYTWSDILQRQNNTDFQDVNIQLSLGLRY